MKTIGECTTAAELAQAFRDHDRTITTRFNDQYAYSYVPIEAHMQYTKDRLSLVGTVLMRALDQLAAKEAAQ